MIDAAHAFEVMEASHAPGPLKPAREHHAHHSFLRAIRARVFNR